MSSNRIPDHFSIDLPDIIHATNKGITFKSHIGFGVFSDVYLAQYKGQKVALKVTYKSRNRRHTYSQERKVCRILKEKSHKNVSQVLEIFGNSDNTQIWILMIYIEGCDMWDKLHKQKKAFTESVAKQYFRQLIDGLKFLHSLAIVHRDIKPANILIGSSTGNELVVIKYIDFGFSKLASVVDNKAICDSNKGTPAYMAPELLREKHSNYDAFKCDVYSLGIVLYRMLFYELPFQWSNMAIDKTERMDLMTKLKENVCLRYPQNITVSECAKHLIENMLCDDTDKRFGIQQILDSNWMKH